MPDLPNNLASSVYSRDQNQFASNIENAFFDVTDTFNSRCDSDRSQIQVQTTPNALPGLPLFGTGILMINGVKNGQPAGIFIACKADASESGMCNELMQMSGTGDYQDAKFSVTWPANQSVNVASTLAMTANILWRN